MCPGINSFTFWRLTSASQIGRRGQRVAQDSPLKPCGFSRFLTGVKCRKSERRELRYISAFGTLGPRGAYFQNDQPASETSTIREGVVDVVRPAGEEAPDRAKR